MPSLRSRNLETADLLLRPLTEGDAEAYFALCSNRLVMRTWGTPAHRSIEDTRKLIAFLADAEKARTMLRWAIIDKASGALIGDVGFWRFVHERKRAEAGAKLAPEYWSRGYMTQALAAVIDYAFGELGLHSVEANVDPENQGALKLVDKTGFVLEGRIREHSYNAETGRFQDTLLFSVINFTTRPTTSGERRIR